LRQSETSLGFFFAHFLGLDTFFEQGSARGDPQVFCGTFFTSSSTGNRLEF
jgi:hypothetical protein